MQQNSVSEDVQMPAQAPKAQSLWKCTKMKQNCVLEDAFKNIWFQKALQKLLKKHEDEAKSCVRRRSQKDLAPKGVQKPLNMHENEAKSCVRRSFQKDLAPKAVQKPLKMRENEAKSCRRRRSQKDQVPKAAQTPLKMHENAAK